MMMSMDDSNSRKRGRSETPTMTTAPTMQDNRAVEMDAARAAQLRDPIQRNGALNDLLKLSASHESNYSLPGDVTLKELANIAIYDCLEWQQPLPASDDEIPVFRSQRSWIKAPTHAAGDWASHCQKKLGSSRGALDLEQLKTLEVVLVILRNLSFVGANLRLLAYSPDIVAVLVGCVYEGANHYSGTGEDSSSSIGSNSLTLSAIHILVNLAPYLDVSGQKLFSDKLFYAPEKSKEGPSVPDSSAFGQAAGGKWGFGGLWLAKRLDTKEDAVSDVTKEMLLSLTSNYLVQVWSIFPALTQVLTDSKSTRPVIMTAMDLLQELINHARVGVVGSVQDQNEDDEIPTIRAILAHMPDSMLQRLIDLLYVPRLGPDSLDYVDPVHNIVTRVTTLKLLVGYDATVDTDVRDRALDVLVPLLELDSPRMAARLGFDPVTGRVRTRLLDALVPILTTAVGRNEASMLASQLFRELSRAEENKEGLQYVQERLVELASRDARVSTLVWNHLYVTPVVEEDSDADDSDTGDNDNGDDEGSD
jgi:hypothetical protein